MDRRRSWEMLARVMVPAGLCLLACLAAGAERQRLLGGNDAGLVTDGRVHSFVLPQGRGPVTVTVAPEGTVWFTEGQGNGIGRFDPDTGEYRSFPLPHPGSTPRIIAVGADGNLWFSEHDGNRIGRITPRGELREFDIPTSGSQPRAIALGADGNIWFGEFAGNRIGRITPEGRITEFPLPTPDSGPRARAAVRGGPAAQAGLGPRRHHGRGRRGDVVRDADRNHGWPAGERRSRRAHLDGRAGH
jgi:streptogramin lyase